MLRARLRCARCSLLKVSFFYFKSKLYLFDFVHESAGNTRKCHFRQLRFGDRFFRYIYCPLHQILFLGPSYLGCYLDKTPRQLEKFAYHDSYHNTPEKCESACREGSYLYFGLQARSQCFCGNTLAHQEKKDESECNRPCTGDNSKICGGPWRNSLYKIQS